MIRNAARLKTGDCKLCEVKVAVAAFQMLLHHHHQSIDVKPKRTPEKKTALVVGEKEWSSATRDSDTFTLAKKDCAHCDIDYCSGSVANV